MFPKHLIIFLLLLGATGALFASNSGEPQETLTAECIRALEYATAFQADAEKVIKVNDLYPRNPAGRALALSEAGLFNGIKPVFPTQKDISGVSRAEVSARPHLYPHAFTPFNLVATNNIRTYSRGQVIKVGVDNDLNTLQFFAAQDQKYEAGISSIRYCLNDSLGRCFSFKGPVFQPRESAEAIVDMSAGHTCFTTHMGRMVEHVYRMSPAAKNTPVIKAVRDAGLYAKVSPFTADIPWHGSGSYDQKYMNLDENLEWRFQRYNRNRMHGIPQMALARSGETLLLGQTNYEHPYLFDGLVYLSPTIAGTPYEDGVRGFNDDNVVSKARINPSSLDWFFKFYDDLDKKPNAWWRMAKPFRETPVLFMIGDKDLEVPTSAINQIKDWVIEFPEQVFLVIVPDASHDVFSYSSGTLGQALRNNNSAMPRAINAWKYLYWFLNSKVIKKENVPLPDAGYLWTPDR